MSLIQSEQTSSEGNVPVTAVHRVEADGVQVFLNTGHFAIETHVVEIAAAMKEFLEANNISGRG
jgi:hypothetical protein